MKKVAVVIPYFGNWPEWFNVFLETCRHNSSIEWVFFTDCSVPKKVPKNTKFKSMKLEGFKNLLLERTGIEPEIKRSYKVCDFRPAFGEIFCDQLKKYDFWGWGDIDVVYGNLEGLFTESNLRKYDVISVRRRRTSGVLTILRNEKELNKMYKESPDFEKVFKNGAGYAFDESGNFKDRNVFSITDVINKYKKESRIETLFWDYAETDKKIEKKDKKIYWKDGRMYESYYGEELYLYHFIDRKKKPKFSVQENIDMSNGFFIGEEGIREANPSYSVQRRPLFLAGKKVKDSLRWMRDRISQR